MAFDRITFLAAVTALVSAEVGAKLGEAWETVAPEPQPGEGDREAARALAVAMTTLPPVMAGRQIDRLPLSVVELRSAGGEVVSLAPEEAARHPLLAPWLGATFPDALAGAITGGRIATVLAPGAPVFLRFEMLETGALLTQCAAHLSFETPNGTIEATSRYGSIAVGGFGRVAIISGDAAFQVGVALRMSPNPADLDDDEPAADAAATDAVAERIDGLLSPLGTVH